MTEKHAPMKPSWIAIDNSDGLVCSIGTEEGILSTFGDMERRGTHRIARVVEASERKVISYVQNGMRILAICDDGACFYLMNEGLEGEYWLQTKPFPKMPPIPQPASAATAPEPDQSFKQPVSQASVPYGFQSFDQNFSQIEQPSADVAP